MREGPSDMSHWDGEIRPYRTTKSALTNFILRVSNRVDGIVIRALLVEQVLVVQMAITFSTLGGLPLESGGKIPLYLPVSSRFRGKVLFQRKMVIRSNKLYILSFWIREHSQGLLDLITSTNPSSPFTITWSPVSMTSVGSRSKSVTVGTLATMAAKTVRLLPSL
jgi:hypothetical protein